MEERHRVDHLKTEQKKILTWRSEIDYLKTDVNSRVSCSTIKNEYLVWGVWMKVSFKSFPSVSIMPYYEDSFDQDKIFVTSIQKLNDKSGFTYQVNFANTSKQYFMVVICGTY